MYTFTFTARDNGGRFQCFSVKANDKKEAIRKGLCKAKAKAKGDIAYWDCKLNPYGRH